MHGRVVSRVIAATFFAIFLLIQTVVPLLQLRAPRPARFGWQMFTGKPERSTFSLVMRDGNVRPVQLEAYVAQSRGEVDLERALPPHLCRVVPDLAAVRVTGGSAGRSRTHECRSPE